MLKPRADGEVVDDASGRIVYDPPSSWTLDTSFGVYSPNNGTITTSSTANSAATLTFKGSSIQVTCLTWPTGANVSISLDAAQVAIVSTAAASTTVATPKVIWSLDGLETGVTHTITIKKVQDDPTWVSPIVGDSTSHLDLDSFTIGGSIGGSTTPGPVSTGVIVGAVFGGIAVIVLVALFWYIRRRRKRIQLPTGSSAAPFEEGKSVTSPSNEVTSLNPSSTTGLSNNLVLPTMSPTRDEKARIAMAGGYNSEGESSSRGRRWRPSLIALPRGRVMRVTSTRVPEGIPEPSSSEVGTGTTDAHSHLEPVVEHTASPIGGSSALSSGIPETTFSSIPESPVAPSTLPVSASNPSGSSSHRSPTRTSPITTATPETSPRSGEKSTFQGRQGSREESGTGSMLSPTTTDNSRSPHSRQALLREVNALRAQVQQLAQQSYHHGLASDVDPGEPPPEYQGRDDSSDEGDDHRTRTSR